MRIILSPTKKMKTDSDSLPCTGYPAFLDQTDAILEELRGKKPDELQKLWKCNDQIAEENIERLRNMDLQAAQTPAVLAYEGIAFQYMAPTAFEDAQFDYVQEHLRILSAFYGIVKPMEAVCPYRLEMAAPLRIGSCKNLYDFWGESLYQDIIAESRTIINLASSEYSKCIEKYLTDADRFITVTFCEMVKGKLAAKGTYAKMARGEMVRFMAENQVEDPEEIKRFDRLGYVYRADLSTETEFVFERLGEDISE